MRYIIYRLVKFIIKPIFYVLFLPMVEGLENIPKNGGVILAGNHTNKNIN